MVSFKEKIKVIRRCKKILRGKRRIKFIGYMRKTERKTVYLRVK